MNFKKVIYILCALCLLLSGCTSHQTGSAILGISGILVLFIAILRTYSSVRYAQSRKRNRRRKPETPQQLLMTAILYAAALVLVLAALLCIKTSNTASAPTEQTISTETTQPLPTEPQSQFLPHP